MFYKNYFQIQIKFPAIKKIFYYFKNNFLSDFTIWQSEKYAMPKPIGINI